MEAALAPCDHAPSTVPLQDSHSARCSGKGATAGYDTVGTAFKRVSKLASPPVCVIVAGLALALCAGAAASSCIAGPVSGEVLVPELVGSTQEAATGILADADLKLGAVSAVYSDDRPVGQVSSVSPASGEKVPAGTEIDLAISKGPQPKAYQTDICQQGPVAPQRPESDAYVLPESSNRLYSEAEVSGLSAWELSVARNEIYARHGRGFADQELAAYFASQSWYRQRYTPEQFDALSPSPLNDVERANAEMLVRIEKQKKCGGAL